MFDKLSTVESRYEELTARVGTAEIQADPSEFKKAAKALSELEPLVEKFREYKTVEQNIAGAEELAKGSDADMRELAKEELTTLTARRDVLLQDLKVLLIPKDPNDEKNVILEVRAGTGGDEAALFAGDLFRMYTRYAERQGWKLDVMSSSDTGGGGLKEAIVSIEGKGVYSRLKYESGVHRVQRVPATEASGRIHTSTATVAVLPEADPIVDVHINPSDLRIDTFRASGAGGQHVNKTDSAVRITHLPTGLVVECQDDRSQHRNRDRAMSVLASRLLDRERSAQAAKEAAERKSLVGSGDRSERIRTYNFPQGRVTDHRINLTLYKLQLILDGDLDDVTSALQAAQAAEQLAALESGEA